MIRICVHIRRFVQHYLDRERLCLQEAETYRDDWITPVPWCLKVVGWLALHGLQRASCCFTGWVCGLVNKNSRIWKELACNRLNNWVNFWNSTLLVWEADHSVCCEAVWGADRCTWLEAHCSYQSSLHRRILQGTILSWVIFFPKKAFIMNSKRLLGVRVLS